MVDDSEELPLFAGPHVPAVRFRNALERLDLRAAIADCPDEWRDALREMAEAWSEGARRADLERLVGCRRPGWPEAVERTWQRVVGRCLDSHGIPGVLDGEPAAAFLLRGGERERARRSLDRHLASHPRDWRGWALLVEFEPVRAAARCAFHDGPVLDAAGDLSDMVREDELDPAGPWLLPYAWFAGEISLDEITRALHAEGILARPPLPVRNDARAFAWYLVDAGGRRLGPGSVGVVEARARLQAISPIAFRRYLRKVGGSDADRARHRAG
jgi:hypothetical protein